MAKKKGLQAALEALKAEACDLTSLEVQTYTGNLDIVVKDQKDTTNFESILKKVKTSGNLKLVAVTKVNFDGDSWLVLLIHCDDLYATLELSSGRRFGAVSFRWCCHGQREGLLS